MIISINDIELFRLSDIKKRVIGNDISSDLLDDDLKRRLIHAITHKYDECFKRLKNEWEPILREKGVKSVPLDNDDFASLVFSQKDYEDKKTRSDNIKSLV